MEFVVKPGKESLSSRVGARVIPPHEIPTAGKVFFFFFFFLLCNSYDVKKHKQKGREVSEK